jgi:hypothetical protein
VFPSLKFGEPLGHLWLVVGVVHGKMHIHEVIKGFGHLREPDLLREVSRALDQIDELSGEDDLRALLRSASSRHAEARPSLDQSAKASSWNATATRRLTGSSIANS